MKYQKISYVVVMLPIFAGLVAGYLLFDLVGAVGGLIAGLIISKMSFEIYKRLLRNSLKRSLE